MLVFVVPFLDTATPLCYSSLCETRSGEICNACVLLVKRWKKLPAGSKKNWNHVSFVCLPRSFTLYCHSGGTVQLLMLFLF